MPKPTSNATTPRQFRLGQETLDQLDAIMRHHKVLSRAEAIRIAARAYHSSLPSPEPKSPRRTT